MSVKRKILYGLLIVLVVIQFIRPGKTNDPVVTANTVDAAFPVQASLKETLKTSCYDCHSNKAEYPWYTNIQPVGWWIQHHINEGREELNFDEFAQYSPRRQFRKFEEIGKQLEEDEMPLSSYTLIHGNAKLSEAQKKELSNWCGAMRDSMQLHYPADILRMRPRQ
jgi:hypothetical protein